MLWRLVTVALFPVALVWLMVWSVLGVFIVFPIGMVIGAIIYVLGVTDDAFMLDAFDAYMDFTCGPLFFVQDNALRR